MEKEKYGFDIEEIYQEAVKIVKEYQYASTSLLQRRLRIGYMRAANLLDMLEERKVVSEPEPGSITRKVLV